MTELTPAARRTLCPRQARPRAVQREPSPRRAGVSSRVSPCGWVPTFYV